MSRLRCWIPICGTVTRLLSVDPTDWTNRLDILDHLLEIHELGIQHNDFEERNVVLKDGRPFIIDFENATPHECKRAMNIVEGAVAPSAYYFGCREIYRYCCDNGVWRPCE